MTRLIAYVLLIGALGCKIAPLPDSVVLFSPSFGVTGRLAGSGEFLAAESSHSWEFSISSESWFRIEVEPKLHNVQLELQDSSEVIDSSSAGPLGFAMISSKLSAGDYTITMSNLGPAPKEDSKCDKASVVLNIALSPYEDLKDSFPDLDLYTVGFPAIEFAFGNIDSVATVNTFAEYVIDTEEIADGDSIMQVYPFIVPEASDEDIEEGFSGMFTLTFSIYSDFLTTGGLGLIFGKEKAVPTEEFNVKCIEKKTCLYSTRVEMNAATIYTAFSPGEYSVALFYKGMDSEERRMLDSVYSKIPYSIHVKIEPLFHSEDRFNCEAGHIPHSLNLPGLIDDRGFLRYSDKVLADFKGKVQATSFRIEKTSWVRVVTVEPSGINIDVKLSQGRSVISRSNAIGESEGILTELEAGEYEITFDLENSYLTDPRRKFCETFILEIGISPSESVKFLNKHYKLNSCDDKSSLDQVFEKMETDIESHGKVTLNPSPSAFYKLPVNKLSEGELEIYSSEFRVPSSTYVYFEIFSDFVTSDLTLSLEKVVKKGNKIIRGDTTDALQIGGFTRQHFQAMIDKGTYVLKIRTGPTSKSTDEQGKNYYNTDEDEYEGLQNCAAFQIRILMLKIDKNIKNGWSCKDTGIQLLPNTMNTIDNLGIKGTPYEHLPISKYYSLETIAPESGKNHTIKHTTSIYVDSASTFKVLAENRDSQMKLVLRSGKKAIKVDEGERSSHIYFIAEDLEPHQQYTLDIYYFASEAKRCHTFTINLEVASQEILGNKCKTNLPTESIIYERLIDDIFDPRFRFHLDSGLSSFENDEEFSYSSGEKLELDLPLVISSPSAIVTGYLQTSLVESPLYFTVLDESFEVVDWGKFRASHRYEINQITLQEGNYWIRLQEFAPSNYCRKFTMSVLIEDLNLWSDIRQTVKKTEVCEHIDQPIIINTVGQLASNNLHWRKELLLDVDLGQTTFLFSIDNPSILRAFVMPQDNIKFTITVDTELGMRESVKEESVENKRDGLHMLVEPGQYTLNIYYEGSPLPLSRSCPSFELDLQIMTVSELEYLSKSYKCKKAEEFPLKVSDTYKDFIVRAGSPVENMTLNLKEPSLVTIALSYENALLGQYSLELVDSEAAVIENSEGYEDLSMIQASLGAGTYTLVTQVSTVDEIPANCGPVIFSVSTVSTGEVCDFPYLPNYLHKKYQKKDGSMSLYGTFRVPDKEDTQTLQFKAPQQAFARILILSYGVKVDSAVYTDSNLENQVAYSKSKDSASSYIFDVKPQKDDYYIVLTFVSEEDLQECASFELRVEIETVEKTVDKLECKVKTHEETSLLPESQLNASRKAWKYGGDEFAVLDKWIISDEELPEGVVSKGTANSVFKYQQELQIPNKSLLTADASYDYLTNDVTLILENSKHKSLTSSKWAVLSDSSTDFSLSSVIEGIELEAGTYYLTLGLSIAANHLISRYSDVDICFPFSYNLEVVPVQDTNQDGGDEDLQKNTMIAVIPDNLSKHNANDNLLVMIDFQYPMPTGILYGEFVTLQGSVTVKPRQVLIDKNNANRIKALFKGLQPGNCYDLVVSPEKLKTDQTFELDGLVHSFCTGECACNPKSMAICNNKFECICENPYTGDGCYDCIENYENVDDECIKTEPASTPVIESLKFKQKNPVELDTEIQLDIELSTNPFTFKGAKITDKEKTSVLMRSIKLAGPNTVSANSVKALNKAFTKWSLFFEPEDFEAYSEYEIKLLPLKLYDSNSNAFEISRSPTLKTGGKSEKSKIECKNGRIDNGFCVCEEGYTGAECDECDEGYSLNSSEQCVKSAKEKIDKTAYVISMTPSGKVYIEEGFPFYVTVKLTTEPHTLEGLIMDKVSNKEKFANAFSLLKRGSKKVIRPVGAECIATDALTWKIEFNTDDMEEGFDYRFFQINRGLYTAKGDPFSYPLSIPPVFVISEDPDKLSDSFVETESARGLKNPAPKCPNGYTGKNCKDCAIGYVLNLQGSCVIPASPIVTNQNDGSYFWVFVYAAIGGIAIYGLNYMWKGGGRRGYHHLEMRELPDDDEGIDLHSTRLEQISSRNNYDS